MQPLTIAIIATIAISTILAALLVIVTNATTITEGLLIGVICGILGNLVIQAIGRK